MPLFYNFDPDKDFIQFDKFCDFGEMWKVLRVPVEVLCSVLKIEPLRKTALGEHFPVPLDYDDGTADFYTTPMRILPFGSSASRRVEVQLARRFIHGE
jgi:hypothetical protein